MRHTRTKQLIRLTGGKYWEYMPNTKIDEMRKLLGDYELDNTFKWHRESDYGDNWIELGGDGYKYGVLLKAKACYKKLKGLTK